MRTDCSSSRHRYRAEVDAVNGWVYAVDGAGRVEKPNLVGTYRERGWEVHGSARTDHNC